jgi:hypothetical protein
MTQNTHDRYLSAWWSVQLPSGWKGVEEGNCATISKQPRLGVLQVSAARKPEGFVSDEDLQDFAEGHLAPGRSFVEVGFKSFVGFSIEYEKDCFFWKEWWLRSGNLMIYATYKVEEGKESIEKADMDYILSTLIPR